MLNNKRAQLGETMTWVVATIIIIVILVFSVFMISPITKNKKFESDKKTDLLATKDISSFLLEDSNVELIKNSVENENYDNFEEKFTAFLKNLQVLDCTPGWFFELFVDNKGVRESPIPTDPNFEDYLSQYSYYETNFKFLSDSKDIKLKFWGLCR